MKKVIIFVLAVASALSAQQYTRGVGLYPGDPKEYHGPEMVIDSTTYRNLSLHRPAYQSSAYDYNLTAQLVTDGIRDTKLPRWIVSSTSKDGELPKFQRTSGGQQPRHHGESSSDWWLDTSRAKGRRVCA